MKPAAPCNRSANANNTEAIVQRRDQKHPARLGQGSRHETYPEISDRMAPTIELMPSALFCARHCHAGSISPSCMLIAQSKTAAMMPAEA
jgi:hypothetical protein